MSMMPPTTMSEWMRRVEKTLVSLSRRRSFALPDWMRPGTSGLGIGKDWTEGSIDAAAEIYHKNGTLVADYPVISGMDASAPPSNYPYGISMLTGGTGWPNGFATVVTFRHSDARCYQWIVAKTTGATWVRAGIDAATWGSIVPIATTNDWVFTDTGWASLTLIGGATGYCKWRVVGRRMEVAFDISYTMVGDAALTSTALPSEYRVSGYIVPAEAYFDPPAAGSLAEIYMDTGSGLLRGSARGGTSPTRSRGRAQYLLD